MSQWCSPVDECSDRSYPPGDWNVTNTFLNVYKLKSSLAVHTGDDVSLPNGDDIGRIVRAIGAGTVVFADTLDDTWMGLVVIRHDHDNTFTCSRYGHLKELAVKKHDFVEAGTIIGRISETDSIGNPFPPHLHFDIGRTGDNLLLTLPQHWPDKKLSIEERKALIEQHYQSPTAFLMQRLAMVEAGFVAPFEPLAAPLPPQTELRIRVNIERVNIRSQRLIRSDTFRGELLQGIEIVVADPPIEENNIVWREILEPAELRGNWVAERIHPQIDDRLYLVPVPAVEPLPSEIHIEVPVLPTDRLKMRVNIEELNVRDQRSLDPQTLVGQVRFGDELVVSDPSVVDGGIVWRQILEPLALAGKWVAERVDPAIDPRLYLVPVSLTDGDMFSARLEPELVEEPIPFSDATPAPLFGRFKLIAAQSPQGPCQVLSIDQQVHPTLGVNVREFAYFGTSHWPHAPLDHRPDFCNQVRGMNMRWVRFYAAHADFSDDEIVERVRMALDLIAEHTLLAVVVFADSIGEKRLYPRRDEQWHTATGLNHLSKNYFNEGHYRGHYLSLVERLVTKFRDHPGVGMWQLMNEPTIYPDPASDKDVEGFAAFVDEVSARIYELDKTHPISIGMINAAHIKPPERDLIQFAEAFYANRRHIHVVSCHAYQSRTDGNPDAAWETEENAIADIRAAAQTRRAVFWTEFGASQAGDRKAATERFLKRHLVERLVSGALQWGFMIGPDFSPDLGVGDRDFGFSNASFNAQFHELKQLYTEFASHFV